MSIGQSHFDRYFVHLYLRLSKDDDGTGESASIKTQREILHQYAQNHNFLVAGEYVDDGYSGTSYDRPEFRRMCRDIEAGKVRCVLTKDMSRLGRNSARTTDLLEEYFPAHQVRYIAVSEGYDSQNMTGGMAMTAPLMMVMNEMYARDISQKIRSAFQSKMEQGQYIGHHAPYGYQKDPENKNHLVVDYQTAGVVRQMFEMAAEGKAPGQIARLLNQKGIPTPSMYRREKVGGAGAANQWTSRSICKMLKNPVYTGTLVQGKTTKLSFKSKEVLVRAPEEWKVVPHTHQAIVPEELFSLVQQRVVSRKNHPAGGFENVFSGIAFCADCGRNMTATASHKKGASYNLCCGGYKNAGSQRCTNHFIDYGFLREAVWNELRRWLDLTDADSVELIKKLQQGQKSRGPSRQQEEKALGEMRKRQTITEGVLKRLYEDQIAGKISPEFFTSQHQAYTTEWENLRLAIEQLEKRCAQDAAVPMDCARFFARLEETRQDEILPRPLLQALVERIEIGQGSYETDPAGNRRKRQKIRIFYRFAAEETGTP